MPGRLKLAQRLSLIPLSLFCLCVSAASADPSQRLTANVVTDPAQAELVFVDIENFINAAEKIASGASAAETLQSEYLDKASPGLGMFIEKYDLTVERLTRAMAKYPEKYAAMGEILEALKAEEATFRQAYAEIKRVMPDAVFPPTYFVVAGHRGIGSGSIEGPLISVEKESPESIGADLASTLVHEMVHIEQLAVLGEAYFEIFSGPQRTLLATSIREGIATYFSELITGGSEHKNAARDFLLENEAELWAAFRQEMLGNEMGDWLWSDPQNPEQPRDVGYALGARIARSYYESAPDRRQAVREILGVTDYPAFLERSGYMTE
jgi:hypothetical protein